MAAEDASLGGLPDELILEVLNYLNIVRSYETQSTAFKNKEKERSRQNENRILQLSLHSLCLTSRRLNLLTTPILYASFIGSVTRYGTKPLRLFHERLQASKASGGNHNEHLQYVEVRLSDYLCNSFYTDTLQPDAVHMTSRYFYLLAQVSKCAPKLQHLNIAILETNDVSFWKYFTPGRNKTAAHSFDTLQALCLEMHIDGSDIYKDLSFERICRFVSTAPLLSDFRVSGAMTCGPAVQSSELGSFDMLKRLEITDCVLEIELVAQILSACEGLQHVVCEWAFLDAQIERSSDLYNGLLRHSETLRSLHLDLRKVRFADDFGVSQCLGSLRPFKCLKKLTISENCFLGSPSPLFYLTSASPLLRMAELLPPCLASFAMLLSCRAGHHAWYTSLDDSIDMWDLVADCKSSSLNLEDISMQGDNVLLPAPNLTVAFLEVGVHLKLSYHG